MRALTQSELSAFGKCERYHQLRYLKRLRPMLQGLPLRFGTAFHLGIEHGNPQAAGQFVRKGLERAFIQEDRQRVEIAAGQVESMVRGAIKAWSGSEQPSEREVEFCVPLINPETGRPSRRHRLGGKVDGVGADRTYEYKTTSRLDRDYIDRLEVDQQVDTYQDAMSRVLGRRIRQSVYRVALKVSIRVRKNESVPEYLRRVEEEYQTKPERYFHEEIVDRSDDQIELWRKDAWEKHLRILSNESGGHAPRNANSCVGRFGRCEFLDLCSGAVTEAAYRVDEQIHPELGGKE